MLEVQRQLAQERKAAAGAGWQREEAEGLQQQQGRMALGRKCWGVASRRGVARLGWCPAVRSGRSSGGDSRSNTSSTEEGIRSTRRRRK